MAKDLVKFFFMIFILIAIVGVFLYQTIRNIEEKKAEIVTYCKDYAQKQVEAQQEAKNGNNNDSEGIVYETGSYDEIYQNCMAKNQNSNPLMMTPGT